MPILDQLEFLDNPNLEIEKETTLYSWSDIKEITVDYLNKTQKRSSAKTFMGLVAIGVPTHLRNRAGSGYIH